ncbi:tyrosine-type recombinase/integrase [Variovorax dokdonensis]|uniref:Tyrosine-type recombinase/integrase n=1 Tax=Variovorax dokdonensis TaxID=344883 RepID=A0ABT7NG93_9BURK|nr:tyrosine-type recombinase/integrase [Variovorax dokdonensis]MDM0046943.1 tyrosine-type recombinase/integrase [Variovorax dokdonensis]
MKLNDAKLRTLTTSGKHADGAGLYLEITPAGGRYWRMKYRFGGKEKRLAFGVYPTVSLKDARERREEARKALSKGEDPGALRKAAKVKVLQEAANTFEAVTNDWLAHQAGRWEAITLERTRASLNADVFPALGSRPMATVTTREVMEIVKRIEARGASEMATRVLQRIKAAFRYAVTHHRIDHNPMLDLVPSEILKPRKVQHRPALASKELPAFLAKLDAYEGDVHTVCALRLLMLTAMRPGEIRGARWTEFDLDNALWRIPAERMKMRAEHVVPLSKQSVEVVRRMLPLSGDRELVFPSPFYPSKSLSENTLNSALARMGYRGEATAHGFRALFSTIANEAGWNPDVIERQLAHAERNQVRAAYNRSTYLDDRITLMQWWADHLDARKQGKTLKKGNKA